MASALDAKVWLMNGSWRSNASKAQQLGSESSPASASMISGYSSLTVRNRVAFLRLRAFNGWPRTNWPLEALLPRSSQYAARHRALVNARVITFRAARVSTQPIAALRTDRAHHGVLRKCERVATGLIPSLRSPQSLAHQGRAEFIDQFCIDLMVILGANIDERRQCLTKGWCKRRYPIGGSSSGGVGSR